MPTYFKVYRYLGLGIDLILLVTCLLSLKQLMLMSQYVDNIIFGLLVFMVFMLLSSIYLILKTFKFGVIVSAHEIDDILDGKEKAYYVKFRFGQLSAVLSILLGLLCCLVIFFSSFYDYSQSNLEYKILISVGLVLFWYGASKVAYAVWVLGKLKVVNSAVSKSI